MNNFDKILGSLLGLVVADMIAFPLKFEDFHHRKKYFPISGLVEPFGSRLIKKNILIKPELKNKLAYWFPAGFTSVNSQLPLLVTNSIYELSDVDIEDISQKLVKYSFPRDKYSPLGIFRGHSKHLYDSIQNVINGLPLKVCGIHNSLADCIITTLPLGLYYGVDSKSIRNKALELALIFNKDYQAISSACVIAYTASLLCTRNNFDKDILFNIADFARQSEDLASKKYGDVLKDSCEKIYFLSDAIKDLANRMDQPLENVIEHYKKLKDVSMNSAIPVTCLSLYLALNNASNYMGVIKSTIESDLPIDIVAPIVGALVGINSGDKQISPKCIKVVKNIENLETLAKHLKSKECQKTKIKNFFLQELEYTTKQIKLKQVRAEHIEKM